MSENNGNKMEIFRQGDVLIIRVDAVPDGAKLVARENGRVVLAHGETTGHAHAIAARGVKLLEVTASRYLTSDKPFVLRHEEHAEVRIPAGTFRVIRQREYVAPEIVRQVED